MSRRIEVELTSRRDDGTWTWRAAGAKQPKGELDGSLLYDGAAVGDVVRADADFLIDGIVVTGVLPPKGSRKEPERIEILGPPRRGDEELVTTQLAPKGRGRRDGDRRPRRDGDREGRSGDRRPRREGDKASGDRRERRDRPARPPRPAPEPKPKPKRLRAARTHRNEVLAGLPEEQKPVAEQVLRGGIPAVRQAVEKQNEQNKAEGKPEISAAPLLTLAEQLMPALRTAEWRDKAEAALADMAELDLRDLRSVVVASDAAARDEETRALAEQLKVGLAERVEAEHAAWLAELNETLAAGRTVRALRVSSRPPKAGTPFPPELATRLAEETAKSLTAETGSDRYATVLDALAYSPVRSQVTPEGIPAEPTPELLAAVTKLASRIPSIAALFGVEAPSTPARSGRGRSKGRGRGAGKPTPPKPSPPSGEAAEAAPADAPGEQTAAPAAPALDAGEPPAPALDAGDAPAGALDAGTTAEAALESGDPAPSALEPAPTEAPTASEAPTEAPSEAPSEEPASANAEESSAGTDVGEPEPAAPAAEAPAEAPAGDEPTAGDEPSTD